ncbi:non-homologous end-joining factor 1 [Hyperolius riggenbachi]|uniref:non-homologous end-joining factor 1 n=1 Tax=Hyperolius riggenbachi TaxID=752182 RepID=UPI0035A2C45D
MAVSHDTDAHLLPLPWKSLQIGESTFLCKVHFTESSYSLLLSDLTSVWFEEAGPDVIQERSKELNKRLKAPISSFLSHLSRLLLPLLDSGEDGQHRFSCQRTEGTLMLHVKSQLSGLPFYWEFHCREANVSAVCRHLVRPLISMTTALDGQCQELAALLLRKDAEIQDYQESGAVLTRDRLKTETFDEASFQESFLTENVQRLSGLGRTATFSHRLQRLYSAVTTADSKENSRAEDAEHPQDVLPPTGEDSGTAIKEEHLVSQQSMDFGYQQKKSEVPPTDVFSLTQHAQISVSKPKKKKAKGLFT